MASLADPPVSTRSSRRVVAGPPVRRPAPESPPASRPRRRSGSSRPRPACRTGRRRRRSRWISARPRCWWSSRPGLLGLEAGEQVAERLAGPQPHPDRHGVDEHADHRLDAGHLGRAARHGGPNTTSCAPGEAGQHAGAHAASTSAAERQAPGARGRAPSRAVSSAGSSTAARPRAAAAGRSGSAGATSVGSVDAGEGLGPRGPGLAAVARRPASEVAGERRRGGQRVGRRRRRRRARQLVDQQRHRPAVDDDVVGGDDQAVGGRRRAPAWPARSGGRARSKRATRSASGQPAATLGVDAVRRRSPGEVDLGHGDVDVAVRRPAPAGRRRRAGTPTRRLGWRSSSAGERGLDPVAVDRGRPARGRAARCRRRGRRRRTTTGTAGPPAAG